MAIVDSSLVPIMSDVDFHYLAKVRKCSHLDLSEMESFLKEMFTLGNDSENGNKTPIDVQFAWEIVVADIHNGKICRVFVSCFLCFWKPFFTYKFLFFKFELHLIFVFIHNDRYALRLNLLVHCFG